MPRVADAIAPCSYKHPGQPDTRERRDTRDIREAVDRGDHVSQRRTRREAQLARAFRTGDLNDELIRRRTQVNGGTTFSVSIPMIDPEE